MSDNFADFLNDNAGVIGATAGYAVNRNIAATNRHISALRDELGNLQERFAQEQRKDEQERLNRDMLFQVSEQVDAINSAPASPAMYFELIGVADDFHTLEFTSATFNSIQDKSFLSSVSTSIDQSLSAMWETFEDEIKQQVAELADLNYLAEIGDAVAIADKKTPPLTAAFDATIARAESLKNNEPHLFSSRVLNGIMLGSITVGALLFVLSYYAASEGNLLALLGFAALAISTALFIVAITTLDSRRRKYASECAENSRLSHSRREQLVFLQSQKESFLQKLSRLQNAPSEAVAFLASGAVTPQEKFSRVDHLTASIADLAARLGVDPKRLPRLLERQAMGGILARRA